MREQITCRLREKTGRSNTRKLRREGLIPAVIYGKEQETMHLVLDEREFHKVLSKVGGENALIDLKVEEDKKKLSSKTVIIKEVQRDFLTHRPLHIDFQSVRLTEKIRIKVPISIKGEAPGVKAGGILDHSLREIEIECLPRDIPEKIEVNISNLEIGDAIHIKDVAFPPGVVPTEDREVSILSIIPPKVEEEKVPEEEITEPEVIKKEKKEEEEASDREVSEK